MLTHWPLADLGAISIIEYSMFYWLVSSDPFNSSALSAAYMRQWIGSALVNSLSPIIITKNIRYLLWNQGLWRSLNNTYPIFLTPCIRCTNHLCDSCDLIDVNRHFIPSLLRMVQNVDLSWRHRYKIRSPAIVTSQWPIVPAWLLWTLS